MSVTETIAAAPSRPAVARRHPETTSPLPAVQPGQLWLIETAPGGALSDPARHVVDSANVIVYDRALAGTLSGALPLGTYAEAAAEGAPEASLSRCVRFARDGWSVVRMLAAPATQRDRVAGIRSLAEQIAGNRPAAEIAITVIGELARRHLRADGDPPRPARPGCRYLPSGRAAHGDRRRGRQPWRRAGPGGRRERARRLSVFRHARDRRCIDRAYGSVWRPLGSRIDALRL